MIDPRDRANLTLGQTLSTTLTIAASGALLLAACTTGKTPEEPPEEVFEDTWDTALFVVQTPGEDATLRITSPTNGEDVTDTVTVTWEVDGCDIGTPSNLPEGCHVHRVLDGEALPEENGGPWGLYAYQSYDITDLEPGTHTLQMILIPNDKPEGFDDGPHDDPIFANIEFTVLGEPDDTDGSMVDTSGGTDTGDTNDTGLQTDDTDTDVVNDTDTADTDDTDVIGDDTANLDTSDDDGDGYSEADGDCDDGNAAINPAATDIRGDGFDQNCDGIDGFDGDGDGYAAAWSNGTDCDDDDAGVNPGATEIPGNSVDEDCDGSAAP